MIYLCGPHATGKTVIANKLISRGFVVFDSGPFLRELHSAESDEPFGEWISSQIEEQGEDYTDKCIAKGISNLLRKNDNSLSNVILVGNRSYGGIVYVIEHTNDDNSLVIYISTPRDVLKRRYSDRENATFSDADFERLLKLDEDMGLESIRDAADYLVSNSGSLDELENELCGILMNEGFNLQRCKE